ncbi:MAG: sigma-70 family RNA polymerase sigma factor [Acidobacteriia bacterium]|nr:sigma-70 family RNA polymerase sigma factor [Terriglobia bacterium]
MSASTSLQTEPDVQSGKSSADPSWSGLVERIRAGDPTGMEELYHIFSRGVRFYLCRQLGPQDLDDKIHDVFLIITQSICNGELREPERLMGYVRTIIRRQVAGHIDYVVEQRRRQGSLEFEMNLSDHRPDPERRIIKRQSEELALRILQSLHQREREVLIRFYLQEQAPGDICRDMDLTQTQFRLIKSRAKARFGELGRARFSRRAACRQ